ncbi:uncharacterized protein Tco025E_06449, partial [Trypanosoma conorhini]
MRQPLPDIHGKGRTFSAPNEAEFRQRDQWRTVHRVCGSAVSHDGYLKMLQGVRQNFLRRAVYNPKDRLPLITRPRLISEANAVNGADATRFSQGLCFKTEGSGIVLHAPSLAERLPPLCVLEEEERRHLVDTEMWERQVLSQMMVVSYVTFVLREELDALHFCECEQRSNILYEEEKKRYWLQNESDASKELVRFKAALRAKEEKQRRLEEADVLYPVASSARPRYVCHPPQKEPDARNILQRYVRLKHGTHAPAARFSDPHPLEQSRGEQEQRSDVLPALSQSFHAPRFTLRSAVRNTLGIAAYVALLEKDMQARSIIDECEQNEFRGIMELFEEQSFLLRTWRHKRMHLKRLLYWQGQREERRQQVQLALEQHAMTAKPRTAAERAELAVQEEDERERIHIEESICRGLLQRLYTGASMEARLNAAMEEHERSRAALEEDEAIARQMWMQHLELALRASLARAYEAAMGTIMPSQIALLRLLQEHQGAHAGQILTIQRAFRRWKGGRLGWRFTHREVGRSIQAARDAKKIQRGVESLRAFKLSLLADCRAVEEELRAVHEAERVGLCEKEFMHRVVINSQEEWEVAALLRQRRQSFIDDIIRPKRTQCIEEEVNLRRELDVREEFEWHRDCSLFYRLLHVMKQKRLLGEHEDAERVLATVDEAAAFRGILDAELDDREVLRITAVERERQRQEERRALAASLLAMRQEEQRGHAEKIAQLLIRCKAGVLELESTDPSLRNGLLREFLAGRLHLLEVATLQFHKACAAALQREHDDLLHAARLGLLLGGEEVARRGLARAEQDAVAEIVEDMERKTGAELRRLQTETRSANVIKNFYRRYRKGEVGRTGIQSFLREAFAEKRERVQLMRAHESQRQDIQRCRDSLEAELRGACSAKQRAIELEMRVLEEKTEPRERAEVEKMERMLFAIISRNRRTSSFASEGDPVALLWQLESYERVSITREWLMSFEKVFEPKKANLLLELKASKLQRLWRSYAERKRRQIFARERTVQLLQEEARCRAELERLEMDRRVCEVLKPMEGCALLRGYLLHDAPSFLARLCFDVALEAGVFEEEWRNRMLLLWRMRHSAFESAVAREEASERAEMQQSYFLAGVEQVQLVADEGVFRDALWNERLYFLLRMLARAEREQRMTLEMDANKHVLDTAETKARRNLHAAYYNSLAGNICVNLAAQLAAAIEQEEARARQAIMELIRENKNLITRRQGKANEENDRDTGISNNIIANSKAMSPTEETGPSAGRTAEQWQELEAKSAAAVVPGEARPVVKAATEETGPSAGETAEQWQELEAKSAAAVVPGEARPVVKAVTEETEPSPERLRNSGRSWKAKERSSRRAG